jgi:membrane-associated protease RseP (regulator of RpoE activity)
MSTPFLTGLLYFIPALGIAIFLHEGGHFLTAKLFGMKVERFFIGFGPTVWSFRRGETEYGVKLLVPAGGFCKIAGMSPYEDDANFLESERRRPGDPAPEPTPPERQFRNKPTWQRAIVLAAGSVTHFVVGVLLIYAILVIVGLPTPTGTNEVGEVVATVPDSNANAPARAAGLQPGDRIVAVNGRPVADFTDLHEALVGTANRNIPLVYERGGQQHTVTVRPASISRDGQTTAFLGVQSPLVTTRLGPLEGVSASFERFGRVTAASFAGLGSLFTGLSDRIDGGGAGGGDDGGPVGIVGMTRFAGQAIEAGQFVAFLMLLVQFNIFVGIANLLPIPPLDGGYLAFLAKEKLTGRPVDLRKVAPVAALIVVLLVMFTAGVLWLDVTKPISNPFG